MIDLYELVIKENGSIIPTGDSAVDQDRLENLARVIKLVDNIWNDLEAVAELRNSKLASEKEAGMRADRFIKAIKESEAGVY